LKKNDLGGGGLPLKGGTVVHSKLWGHFDPRLQKYAQVFLKYENSYKKILSSLKKIQGAKA